MTSSIRFARRARAAAALALAACTAMGLAPAARAQQAPITPQALIDKAEIGDLLARYYYDLGHVGPDGFSAFYTADAELDLGPKSYHGAQGIADAYKAAGAANPGLKAFSFNVLLSNPLITVHGDQATARLIFTEVVIDKEGAAPHMITQGREFDHLARVNGQWRFTKRQIMSAAQTPPGWTD